MMLSQLSTSQDHIIDFKLDLVVHAGVCGCWCGELIWTRLVWAERSKPGSFWCQASNSIPPQVSRKESLGPLY